MVGRAGPSLRCVGPRKGCRPVYLSALAYSMAREAQCTVCGLRVGAETNQRTIVGDEPLDRTFADNDRNYVERERLAVLHLHRDAVQSEKQTGGRPAGALVALLERMVGRYAEAKDAREVKQVLLARIGSMRTRPRYCTFQQTPVAHGKGFTILLDERAILVGDGLGAQPYGLDHAAIPRVSPWFSGNARQKPW